MSNFFDDILVSQPTTQSDPDRKPFSLRDVGFFTVEGKINAATGEPYKKGGELGLPGSPSRTMSFDFKGSPIKNVGVYYGTLFKKPFVFNIFPISADNYVKEGDDFVSVIPAPPLGKKPTNQKFPLVQRFAHFLPKEMYRKFENKETGEKEMSKGPVDPRPYPAIVVPVLMQITSTEFIDDEEVTNKETLIVLFTQYVTRDLVEALVKAKLIPENGTTKDATEYLFSELSEAKEGDKLSVFRLPSSPKGEAFAVKLLSDKQPPANAPFFDLDFTKTITEEELERTILLNEIIDKKNAIYGTDKTSPVRLLKNALYDECKAKNKDRV